MGYVYKITNLVNDMSYIGISINKPDGARGRIRSHLKGYGNQDLKDDVIAYGKDSFSYEILEENILPGLLPDLERFYIKKFNTLAPSGYNHTTGGELNKSVSKETRQKQSEARMGVSPWNKGGGYTLADIWNHQDEVIRLYKAERKTTKEIADVFKVCSQTVTGVLKSNGIKLINTKRTDVWNHIDEVIRLYTAKKKSINEVAKTFCSTPTVIKRILKTNNISIRKNKGENNFFYGKPAHNRSDAWNNQDEVIRLYTEENLPLTEIGKMFNACPQSISGILKSNNIKVKVGKNQFQSSLKGYSESAKELFFSLPPSMDIAEKRKVIREKYSGLVDKSTVYNWVKKWTGISAKSKYEPTYDLCRKVFFSLPKNMQMPEKQKILCKKFPDTHRTTIYARVIKWQSETD